MSVSRMEKEQGRREDILRQEISDLQQVLSTSISCDGMLGWRGLCLFTVCGWLTTSGVVCEYDASILLLGYIWNVMLVWRVCWSLCYSVVYHCNGAQLYEQFLQVGRLYWSLILLDLALCFPSASVSSVFMVLYIFNFCHAMLCVSTAYAIMLCIVHLSVRRVCKLC